MDKLISALGQLDTSNDDHWTQEGLPRLDVLKTMTGETVTRAQIFEISKTFNRYNTSLEDETVEGEESEAETEEQGEAETTTEAEQVVVTAKEGEPENFKLIEQEYLEAKLTLQAATNKFEVAREKYDHVIRFREQAKSNVPHSQIIKSYQAMQAKNRAELVEKANLVKKITGNLTDEQKAVLKEMG